MTAITVEEMRSKLLPLSDLRDQLSTTEPLSQVQFSMIDGLTCFALDEAWAVGLENKAGTDTVDATISVNRHDYALTKDALLEATSAIGLPKRFVTSTPAKLIKPLLDHHYTSVDKDMKLLARENTALAITKASISPFSNLRLINLAVDSISAAYGASEILVDYKLTHDLRKSHMRLIVAGDPIIIKSARHGAAAEDAWYPGLSIKNSLVGDEPLSINGYLFAWWCTNGQTSTRAASGNYRRNRGQNEEVYDWAQVAIDEILGHLDHEFEAIEALTQVDLDGDMNEVLRQVFSTYRVPLGARESIIESMVENTDPTAYGLMSAITQAANDMENTRLSPDSRDHLLNIGGDLPWSFADSCPQCHAFRK